MSALVVVCLLVAATTSAAGMVLFRFGARGNTQIGEYLNLWILLGCICYTVGALAALYSLSRVSAVSVYPFTVLQAVLISIYSAVFLGETLSAGALVGCALVLIGLFAVIRSSG